MAIKKLSIAIDMGAKNNGVFIVKSYGNKIVDKKANCITIDEKKINFSKKSRRENRHKDRNYKRRKLAKRLLKELIDFNSYDKKQQESILGLLNNRGYTFVSTSTEFEQLNDITVEFISKHLNELDGLVTKDDFENKISEFDDLGELSNYIDGVVNKIDIEVKKKKAEFYKEFQPTFSNFIKKDLQQVKKLLMDIQNEIDTGSKPRKKYLEEIKEEIDKDFDFIQGYSKDNFFNLIGNISNLQLRVLRKYFNNKFNNTLDKDKLDLKIRRYFKAHHFKSDKEKTQRKNLFKELGNYDDIVKFLVSCNPELTIPPYEDMNNRDTYKCNSMLIKPEVITDDIKEAIDFLLSKSEFEFLKKDENGELKVEKYEKTKTITNNQKITTDFTYSKYLQRILDIKLYDKKDKDGYNAYYHPRNVFKYKAKLERGAIDSVEYFQKVFGKDTHNSLKNIAEQYYKEEEKILGGIYEESTSILIKCNTNTPYKNNAKHILLKPIYSYNFTNEESDKFLEDIKNTYGLQKALQRVSDEAKKYQNSFYHIIEACFENEKCIDDKEIKAIATNLDKNLQSLKEILKGKNTYLSTIDKVDSENLKRVVNIFKQTYEILFKELGGFNKTCKHCTIENSIRSDENNVIAKRLLSDVAKPIDGMLDMMLDRLAFEISENIEENDIKDISHLEILLEQNRFEFEESLNTIKRANNNQIKKYKNENKDKLNISICPYSGKKFEKGDWDHILPQSKGVYNSKANMIYCSIEGNQKIKGAKDYTLEMLDKEHLKAIFKTEDTKEIKTIIKYGLANIDTEKFTNFNNLKLKEQIAVRYGLFCKNDKDIFGKAFEIVKKDKLKTITNGTQKRLARFIYEKLVKKFSNQFNDIEINSKTINNQLVSSTRKFLAVNQETGEVNHLFKEDIQKSHSHCIDAMVVFYLANSRIKGQKHRQKENINSLEPIFDFDDIFLDESSINNLTKNKTFINSPKKELGSYKLFDDTIYSENYKHITTDMLKQNEIETLIKHNLLFESVKNKKIFVDNLENIKKGTIYKLDVQRVSNIIYDLFNQRNKAELSKLKLIDKLRYCTSRKEIQNIFFDDKQTKLLEFDKIKNIPQYSGKLYKAVYKKLQNGTKLFDTNEDNKTNLNYQVLEDLLKNMFVSKQKRNQEIRKRGKKRHKYTLPILGSPKFRIKRGDSWQVLGNNDIATKNYIIDGKIKPIPFFSKNTIPLKIGDLLDCLLIDKNSKSVYDIEVNINQIDTYISRLKYIVTEAKRCTVEVSLIKSNFKDINFKNIEIFDGDKDSEFKLFLEQYIENKDLLLNKYIGSIRDGLKAKATILDNNNQTITLQYKAAINNDKKQIILDNLEN